MTSKGILKACSPDTGIFEFDQFSSINLVPSELQLLLWKSLGIFGKTEYLNLIGGINGSDPVNHFVAVSQNGAFCGVLHFQEVSFTGNQLLPFIPEALGERISQVIMRILKNFKTRILVAGNIFMTGDDGIHVGPDFSDELKGELYVKAVNWMLRGDSRFGAFLLSDRYGQGNEFDRIMVKAGFRRTESEPDMVLKVRTEWKNFDGYLAAMSTKYRTRVKRVIAKNDEFEHYELSVSQAAAMSSQLDTLYRKLTDNVKLKLAIMPRGYFASQKALEPQLYRLFVYCLNEKPVAFISYFTEPGCLQVHHVGRDPELTTRTQLYEKILLDSVSFGIELGLEVIHFGRTATEVKSTVGAEPVNMHGYVYHTNTLLNGLFSFMSRRLAPKPFVLRHPFKTIESNTTAHG